MPAERLSAAPSPAIATVATADPKAADATVDAFGEFRNWTARYLGTPPEQRERTLGEGVTLAARRRDAMAALIPQDPRRALEEAVPMTVRQELPPEVVAQLEERVSTRGFFGVLGVAGAPAGQASIRREVRLEDGRRFETYTFGRRAAQPTIENAALTGISVPNPDAPRRALLALDERPLRVLEPGERPDPTRPAVETCPVSGNSTAVERTSDGALPPITDETPAVEIGGTIHYVCHGGHIQAVEEGLIAAEGATGGAAKPTGSVPSSQSTGVRSLLYMRVAFPESNREPQTEAAAYEMMRQVNEWLVENSYGNVYLVTTVAPLIVLPYSEAWYKATAAGGDEYDVQADARVVARQMGYDTNQYDLDIVAYTGGPGSFGGLGYVGSKGTWLKSINVGVACHELGHNFGLWHANFWSTTDGTAIGNGSNSEYGNTFDTMGSASAGDLHFNANHRTLLSWLPTQAFVTNVTTSGTYRIFAFDQPRLDPANRYAFRVRKDNMRQYWAEFRQRSLSGNKWTRDGILLNWGSWTASNGGAQLLDTTPGSPDGKTDAATVIGVTFSDTGAGIHITPVGKGGTIPESIDVVVNLGTFPGNQPPTLSIAASGTEVDAGESVDFTATASDPDADALAYAWDFGDRTFSNTNSASVSKSWSTAGEFAVRCTVSDMKGHTASETVIVTVGAPDTYRISGQVTMAGQPLPDVRVSNGLTGSAYRGALTDDDGHYTITGLSAGSVSLSATLGGHTFAATGFANPVTVGPNFTGADFIASETPVVSIVATDPEASENPGNPGQLTLSRTGPTTAPLTVRVVPPSGGAVRAVDYTLTPDLSNSTPYLAVSIPAGQSSLTIDLTPIDDAASEGLERAVFELGAGSGYLIGSAAIAEITIEDSESTLPVVRLRVADADATENGDSAGFVITRTGVTTDTLVVRFTTSGTAFSGVDYAAPGSQVTIPAGQSSAPLTITPLNDSSVEGTETVTVSLSTDPAYIRVPSATENSGTVNILDDDIATLTVVATDPTASENGADTGTFIITRTGSTAQPLTVNYALAGSALQGVDYLPLPGSLVIPAGSTVGSVTITPFDDTIGEPAQSVLLQLRGGAGYVAGDASNATVTIADGGDLPVLIVGVSDGAVAEPSDTGKFKFTTTGSGTGNITVHYSVTGTATAGADYAAFSGTLSMGRNTTTEITVTPLDDSELEGFETVTVTITPDAAYSTHLDTSATINLADDDQPVVSVSATNQNFNETTGTGRFYFSRTGAVTNALAVNYTLSGTATSSDDYTAPTGFVTFAAGSATAQLDIAPINDTIPEGTETIVLTLAAGDYGHGLASATCYLADNDALPIQVKFTNATGSGGENAGTIDVPVILTAASAAEVTVEYVIGGGSATAEIDYTFHRGVLTFAPGEVSKTIPLTIIDDAFNEPAQTVLLRLQNAREAALAAIVTANTFTYTITDNDPLPPPTIGFASTSASGAEALTAPQIIVSLSAAQTTAVSINVAGTGTATAGTDFTGGSGLLTFAPGETAKVLPVTIVDDLDFEVNETIILTLESPSGANLGANAALTYTINDDDAQYLTIVASGANTTEGSATGGSFTLTRTGSTADELIVNLAITGTAANGTDYQAIPSTLAFPPGETTAVIPVTTIDDALDEPAETVIATIIAGPYVINAPASTTVTITDDDANQPPVIAFVSPVGTTAVAIPGGVGLILEATVADDGKPLAPGAVTATWSHVSGPGTVTFGSASEWTTTAQFSAPGAYVLQLAANDGELQATRALPVIVGGGGAWTGTTINNATPAGSFTQNGGIYTVAGGGSNITGTSDQFYFVQQALSSDFRFTARITSFAGGNSSAKAGVMFRAGTAAGSAGAFMSLYGPASTTDANSWRYRATNGASYSTTGTAGPRVYPAWVRLTRIGSALTGETSANGTTWTTVGSVTSALPSAGLIGLAVTSNNTAALASVTFDNVSLTSPNGNVGPLVNAGPAQTITQPMSAALAGTITDDGLPAPASVTTHWEKISGPGSVTFADPSAPQTTATFTTLGTYILRLRADDGWVRTFHDVTVTNALPVVTVTASQPSAAEADLVEGTFTATRTGDGAGALEVPYSLSGTATENVDYRMQTRIAPLNGFIAFDAGQTSVEVYASPLADSLAEGSETVKLTVSANPAYTVGAPASATVTIADLPLDGWRLARFGANANNPAIAGDNVDPDGDGRVNWWEFALGDDPLSATLEALPEAGLEASDITLTYRRPAYAPGFIYGIEETLDLALAWQPAGFTEETISYEGDTLLIKARIPAGSGSQKLLRLRVTKP